VVINNYDDFSSERYCLVFWPEEKCYSEVLEAKLLEPKEATVGVVAKVKEGGKIHSGTIVMVGTRAEVERRLNELERVDSSEAEDQGKL
jgi:predicted thioesterase